MGYKFQKYSIGGGGSGVGEYINMECYWRYADAADSYFTLKELFMRSGASPAITYYVVDALPESPNVSDLTTGNHMHIYFYNDVPYLYGNAGYGNMWLGVTDVLAASGITTTAKGFTSDITKETEEGVYVTYLVVSKENFKGLLDEINAERNNVRNLISRGLVEYEIPDTVDRIGSSAFARCTSLVSIKIPTSVLYIEEQAFSGCLALTSVVIPESVLTIDSDAFTNCNNLASVTLPASLARVGSTVFANDTKLTSFTYNGTKEQWKAISKTDDWDRQTPDYIITCTDGTIAKDGTET